MRPSWNPFCALRSPTPGTTHVQHRLPGARGNPPSGGNDGSDDEDNRWDDIESIAGSILSHCDTDRYWDFVPDYIATIASNVLAERYDDVDHDDISEMLDWYEDSFDEYREPIYDDDDDDDEYDDDLCSWCDNKAALDCDYGNCGACCDESDCERHGWN